MRRITFILCLVIPCLSANAEIVDSLLNEINQEDIAKAKVIQGHIFLSTHQFDSAMIYFHDAKEIYQREIVSLLGNKAKENIIKGEAECFFKIGNVYYYTSKYDSAILYYDSALLAYKSIENEEYIGKMLKNKGACLQLKGEYLQALECYQEALIIAEKIDNKLQIADCYNNIANTYSGKKEFSKALKSFEEALEIFREIESTMGIAYTLNNMDHRAYYCYFNSFWFFNYSIGAKKQAKTCK